MPKLSRFLRYKSELLRLERGQRQRRLTYSFHPSGAFGNGIPSPHTGASPVERAILLLEKDEEYSRAAGRIRMLESLLDPLGPAGKRAVLDFVYQDEKLDLVEAYLTEWILARVNYGKSGEPARRGDRLAVRAF